MDAKPVRSRALRANDENMLPPAAMNNKTLHQRTKSVPTFSTLYQADAVKAANKKVLGDANANLKIAQPSKDDTALDKKAVISVVGQDKLAAPLSRPATRPFTSRSVSSQQAPSNLNSTTNAPLATKSQGLSQIAEAPAAAPKKLVIKKSTKVLRDANTASHAEPQMNNAPQPSQQSSQITMIADHQGGGVPLPHQEIRKIETVPLRDAPATRSVPVEESVPSTQSHEEYMAYLGSEAALQQATAGLYSQNLHAPVSVAPTSIVPSMPAAGQQYTMEEDDDDYYYEDGYTTSRSFGLRGESTGGVTTVLLPRFPDKVMKELEQARIYVDSHRTEEDVEDELWDTSMVAEYGDEIFGYMKDLEQRMAPNPLYMEQQTEIQWSMRSVLIDWIVQVHARFALLPETLFLTINYVDRFLSCKIVSLAKLQLVGATALFVAAKYEEVNCPTIQEIIYMVDGGYSMDELLKAERFMLSMLQFELGWPGPMSFLRRISKADDYDLETRTLAKYFLEITIMDERFVGCTPSFLAAGAHCMARLMLEKGDWSLPHVHFSGYTYGQLRVLLSVIMECCESPRKHHSAVFDKYCDKRYKRASTYVEAQMLRGFSLPKAKRVSSMGVSDGTVGGFLR